MVDDNPVVQYGGTPKGGTAAVSFRDASGNAITPQLRNGASTTLRMRIAQSSNSAKYFVIALPECFSSPTSVSDTFSSGTSSYTIEPGTRTDNFIVLSGDSMPAGPAGFFASGPDDPERSGLGLTFPHQHGTRVAQQCRMVVPKVVQRYENAILRVEGEERFQKILFIPQSALPDDPIRRVVTRCEDIVDVNQHSRIQASE